MKPLKQLRPDDIHNMSDEEFTALILMVGPLHPPRNEPFENYFHNDDWNRLWDELGSSAAVIEISRRLRWARIYE